MYSDSDSPRKELVYCRVLPILEFERDGKTYIFGSSDGIYKLPNIPILTALAEIDKLFAKERDLKLEWESDPDVIIKKSLEDNIPGITVTNWEEDVHTPFDYDDERYCWTRNILIKVDWDGSLPDEFEPGADPIEAEQFYNNYTLVKSQKKPHKCIK